MADFYEIDFLAVETAKSGDAIALRYEVSGVYRIHVVDGGFTDTGDSLVSHIRSYYGQPDYIDHVVLTHPDGDHACGLKRLIESDTFLIGQLWMNRPWLYANELLPHFKGYTSADALARRLREIYSHVADLEVAATERGIPIFEAFQGSVIGAFVILAPSKARYLDLVLDSPRTPDRATAKASTIAAMLEGALRTIGKAATNFFKSAWGEETFSSSGTSRENEMSIVQYAYLNGRRILLTGDAGREALTEAADYAPWAGLALPGIDKFQVPHHGSRRNVSTEVLDRILGPRLPERPADDWGMFSSMISSAAADPDHPRKSVIRAMRHRGASVIATEGTNRYWFEGVGLRPGWSYTTSLPYPDEQES